MAIPRTHRIMTKLLYIYSFLLLTFFRELAQSQQNSLDEIIMNKIVLCTGPAYGRKQMLESTIEHDNKFIQYKKIFLVTNDRNNLNIVFGGLNPICLFIPRQDKQLDCLNCIISNLRIATDDPTIKDDDIIIFKHESVYINDMSLVRKAIRKIYFEDYDLVIKYWDSHHNGGPYFHTDSFYVKVSAARSMIKDQPPLILADTEDYLFCEDYFTYHLVNQLKKVYKINYCHSAWKDNELGFYHIGNYEENDNWYWNKNNYFSLYT